MSPEYQEAGPPLYFVGTQVQSWGRDGSWEAFRDDMSALYICNSRWLGGRFMVWTYEIRTPSQGMQVKRSGYLDNETGAYFYGSRGAGALPLDSLDGDEARQAGVLPGDGGRGVSGLRDGGVMVAETLNMKLYRKLRINRPVMVYNLFNLRNREMLMAKGLREFECRCLAYYLFGARP